MRVLVACAICTMFIACGEGGASPGQTDGAVVVCDEPGSTCGSCYACAFSDGPCDAPIEACHANPACLELDSCIAESPERIVECREMYPDGVSDYDAILSCIWCVCEAICDSYECPTSRAR